MKRVISMILVFLMLISLLPTATMAEVVQGADTHAEETEEANDVAEAIAQKQPASEKNPKQENRFFVAQEEPLGLTELSYPFSLAFPVRVNGKEYTVSLADTVVNKPTQTTLEASNPTASVTPDTEIAVALGGASSADKSSITYPITLQASGASAYTFSVTFRYNSLTGGASYAIDAKDSDSYMAKMYAGNGSFALTDAGFAANQTELAFTAMERLGTKAVSVNWNDNNDSARPSPAYTLWANGTQVDGALYTINNDKSSYNRNTLTISADQLPLYEDNGNAITYTVKQEDSVREAYLVSPADAHIALGGELVNTKLTSISITKVWNDDANQHEKRPSQADWLRGVSLYQQVYGDRTISEPEKITVRPEQFTLAQIDASQWLLTVSDLPMYDAQGDLLEYCVSDSVPETVNEYGWKYVSRINNINEYVNAGYDAAKAYNGGALISTRTAQQSLTFYKRWVDGGSTNRPNLTLYLFRMLMPENVSETTQVLGSPVAGMDSMYLAGSTFNDGSEDPYEICFEVDGKSMVPKYDVFGKEYLYYAVEGMSGENADSYTNTQISNVNGELKNHYLTNEGTIINRTENITSIYVQKKWDAKSAMGSVTKTDTTAAFVLQQLKDGVWQDVKDEDGQPYRLTMSGFSEEQTELQGIIAENLPLVDENREPIAYRVAESSVLFMGSANEDAAFADDRMTAYTAHGFRFTVAYEEVQRDDQGNLLFEVTNKMKPTTDVQIRKFWSQNTPWVTPKEGAYIVVELYRDEEPYALTQDSLVESLAPGCEILPDGKLKLHVNGLQPLTAIVRGLPAFDAKTGSAYVWSAVEVDDYNLNGYGNPTYTVNMQTDVIRPENGSVHTISMHNTYGPGEGAVRVVFMKHWLDGEAASTRRPVLVQLYHLTDGAEEAIGEPVVLSDDNSWYQEMWYTLEDKEISHYLTREVAADGKPVIDGRVTTEDAQTGYTYETYSTLEKAESIWADLQYSWVSKTYNKRIGTIDVSVDKTWKTGGTPYKSSFDVYRNGEKLFDVQLGDGAQVGKVEKKHGDETFIVTVKESGDGIYRRFGFSVEVDKYDENGFLYVYEVKETAITVNGKEADFSNNVALIEEGNLEYRVVSSIISDYEYGDYHTGDHMGVRFTNTFEGESSMVVYKLWRDAASVARPDIVMNLYRRRSGSDAPSDDKWVSKCYWDTHTNSYFWMCTFGQKAFPLFDEEGYRLEYYVEEEILNGTPEDYYYTISAYNGPIKGQVNARKETSREVFSGEATGGIQAICGFVDKDNYEINPDDLVEAGMIINTLNRKALYRGVKIWKNLPAWYEAAKVPDILVGLFRQDPFTQEETCVQVTKLTEGKTAIEFAPVVRYDMFGNEYTYTIAEVEEAKGREGAFHVEEDETAGTYVKVSEMLAYDITASNGTITNTYHSENCSITVEKTWKIPANRAIDGKYAYPEVSFQLYKTFGETAQYTIPELQLVLPQGNIAAGEQAAIEPVLSPYVPDAAAQATNAFAKATKNGDFIDIQVSATIEGLAVYAPDNTRYQREILECKVDGYTPQRYTYETLVPILMNEDNTGSVSFENHYDYQKYELLVKKLWVDSNNAYGTRPNFSKTQPALTLQLFRNGSLVTGIGGEWVEEKGSEWIYKFTSDSDAETFPAYDTAGNPYQYTVSETWSDKDSYAAKWYVPSRSTKEPVLTNKLTVYKRLFVDKSWVNQNGKRLSTAELKQLKALGYAPDSVTFQVFYQDGEEMKPYLYNGQAITMQVPWEELYASVANNTLLTFTYNGAVLEVPKYDKNNQEITYEVREIAINDTPVTADGSVQVGANTFDVSTGETTASQDMLLAHITNGMRTKKLRFVKCWEDERNRDGVRPQWDVPNPELTLTVSYKIGAEPGGSFVIPDANIGSTAEWTGRWVLNPASDTENTGEWSYEITVPDYWTVTDVTENKTGAAWEKYYSEEVIFAPDINPNLYTVINTHEVLTFDIAVQKKWADDANAWKTRPQDIELTLKQNGNKNITYKEDTIEKIEAYLAGGSIVEKGTQTGLSGVDSTTTATAAENRDIVHWYELPLYQPKTNAANKSVPYTYKVEEKGVVGYKVSYVGQQVVPVLSDAGSKKSVTVTNTLNRIEVQAKKNWSGDYNNAFQSRVGKLVFVLTVQDNDGALWYVEKKAASGYYEMTKTAPANASDAQTNYLTVTIDGTANGETKKLSVAIPKNHNGYKWSTAQLVEVNPPRGYTPAANGSAGTTTTTNTLTETVPLAVEKTWVETAYSYESQTMRPQPVFDIYYKHGEAAEWKDSGLDGYIKVTDRDDAKTVYDVFTDATCKTPFALPKTTGDGTTISYDAREKTMYGYTTVSDMHSIRTLGDGTFVVAETNAQELTDVTVRKEWREDDAWSVQTRPDAVTLTLQFSTNDAIWTNVKQSGQPVRVTLNEANNWSATVTGLAVKNARGNVIKYRFAEPDMEGYAVSYAAVAAKTAQVVTTTTGNTLRTVELSGSKVWKNDGVYGSSLRGSIALNVYQNEVLLDRSKYELSWNGWSYRITGLPRADKAGNLYTYRVEEDTESVSKAYAATDAKANPTSEDRYKLDDLVNTFRIIKLSGTKVWDDDNNRDGYRPDTVSLKLYQNQKLLTSGYTLTWEKTGNTWTYTFSNLPQRDASGNAYVYTVREESVANYETSYGEGKSEAEEGGRTVNPDGTEATASMTPITNIHEPKKIRIEGSKTWVDDDNRDGNRPTSITIRLYANGEEIKAQEVTKEDDWKWSFEDLYKYEDGKEIVYTVTEDEVNGYTTEVEGYDVTNLRSNALVSIRKTGDKGDALAGAEFCLYAAGEEPVIPEGDLPVAKATSGEDGIARFGAIDLGAYYLVEHEAPKGYVKSEALYRIIVKADGVTMEGLEDGVWIAVPDFTVANERERYEVEIIKTVSGEAGDHKKQFSFRVECSDEMEEGEGYTLSEDKKTATFLLRHDEHILLQGIPFGAALSVTEENLAADGYEMKLLIDGKSVKNPITVKEDLSITVNNSIEEVPDTGDSVTALPFILLLAASGISTLAVLLLKRRIRGAK